MAYYEPMSCKNCKHYESYHQHPNPLAVSPHWCKKCNDEIKYIRSSLFSDSYSIRYPRMCYFNDYFEESEEYLKEQERREKEKRYYASLIE